MRVALIAFVLLCAAAVVGAVYLLAEREALQEMHAVGNRQLQIVALDLVSVLEKFETLPFSLSYQPEAMRALSQPDDKTAIAHLNIILESIQQQAKVAAIYLMDSKGNTIASSNWDESAEHNFIGRNFSFRPYFQEAMAGRAGRFYGIGNASGEAGYFITQPVYGSSIARIKGTPIGAIAVKIGLDEFEQNWRSSDEPIALADRNGVIFLSNRPEWKYRSLHNLSEAESLRLIGTQQYGNLTIQPIASLPPSSRAGFGAHVSRPVGSLGWQLMLFPSPQRAAHSAMRWAGASSLVMALAGLWFWASYQRRKRLEEGRFSRDALERAAEDLERTIALRTEELISANQNLETRYETLKQTEHLLRSTQNELVQAGKLTMLGQMAAGVTHELNQPLAAIRAFADNAETFLSRGQTDKATENLVHISNASARMGKIIAQLKGFAHKSHDTVATVDLSKAIQASALLLRGEFDRNQVTLKLDLQVDAKVVGDSVRTEQVLINVLRNALDALENVPDKIVTVVLTQERNDAVVKISDTGTGIPEKVAPHLFEPFFTTKTSGKGLGLGLAISSSIVQAMNGTLTAKNNTHGGAEFVLRLPLLATVNNRLLGELIVNV